MTMRNPILYLVQYLFFMTSFASAEPNPLGSFRWDYRIILVAAPVAEVEDIANELKEAKAGINERDILWFVFGGESFATNYTESLAKGFEKTVSDNYFKKSGKKREVRLVGKDGGVKEKADNLDLERLFALIDSMPMRRAEMRSNY